MAVSSIVGRRVSDPFAFARHGVIMEPDPSNPDEVEGVLNPAAARGPDGELYLFPRIVAAGNKSRIGIARVLFDGDHEPVGVERLGIALEPSAQYEMNPLTGGGCEDPRITYVEVLRRYVMTYTAFSPLGPRIALAVSKDLMSWRRLGLVQFSRHHGRDFDILDNKDALLFPTLIENPRTGRPALALIHRPFLFSSTTVLAQSLRVEPPGPVPRSWMQPGQRLRAQHPSMWISYCDMPHDEGQLTTFGWHHRLMSPRAWWEHMKIGGGTPPLRTAHGWLVIYHGVSGHDNEHRHLRYSAGAVVLDLDRPERIRYRTSRPILRPRLPDDRFDGLDVVFPTGVDQRSDIGQPDRIDVYFGMADQRIGVATMHLPPVLDLTAPARGGKGLPRQQEKAVGLSAGAS